MDKIVIEYLFLGFAVGMVANGIWYYYCVDSASIHGIERGKYVWGGIWVFFEHYHWATIFAILGFRLDIPFFIGLSTALLIDEGVAQEHKFAIGSGHFIPSTIIEVVIISLWILSELVCKLLGF